MPCPAKYRTLVTTAMVKFETSYHSKQIAATIITAEYDFAYSENDYNACPAISFPLVSCFDYSVGSKYFQLSTNDILFEKGETAFKVSKYKVFNKDVTLCIQFFNPGSEVISRLSENKKQVSVITRTIETEMLLRKFYSIGFSNNEMLKEQLLADILNSVAYGDMHSSNKTKANPHIIKQLDLSKDFIHAYYYDDLRIADIASAAFVSPFHFSRLFRQHTGYTPYNYLLKVRIENAKSLLITGVSSTQAAFSTGFNSLENFSLAFSRIAGCSPSFFGNSKIY